jgi:hypothetical protein
MALEHANLTGSQLHEPKGISAASAGKVYISNGAGSGVWSAPGGSVYGEIYVANGVAPQTLPAASAYARVDANEWAANGANGTTLNTTDGTITVPTAGVYFLSFWATFTTASLAAGTKYNFKYAINGTPAAVRFLAVQKNTAGSDVLTCSATGIYTASANDVISVHVAGDGTSSSTNITVNEAGFSAILLRAT